MTRSTPAAASPCSRSMFSSSVPASELSRCSARKRLGVGVPALPRRASWLARSSSSARSAPASQPVISDSGYRLAPAPLARHVELLADAPRISSAVLLTVLYSSAKRAASRMLRGPPRRRRSGSARPLHRLGPGVELQRAVVLALEAERPLAHCRGSTRAARRSGPSARPSAGTGTRTPRARPRSSRCPARAPRGRPRRGRRSSTTRQLGGVPEGRGGDQRAEPQRARYGRERRQRRPGVERAALARRRTPTGSGRSGTASRPRAPRRRPRAPASPPR